LLPVAVVTPLLTLGFILAIALVAQVAPTLTANIGTATLLLQSTTTNFVPTNAIALAQLY